MAQDEIKTSNDYSSVLRNLFDDKARITRRLALIGAGAALYSLPVGTSRAQVIPGEGNQKTWRFCYQCFAMYYDGDPERRKGACPVGRPHAPQGLEFELYYSSTRRQPFPGRDRQFDWRFCRKCFVMFWDGDPNNKGKCTIKEREFTYDQHDSYGFIFGLPLDNPTDFGQNNWRYCGKCRTLFYDDPLNVNKGTCPADQGKHASYGFNFKLPFVGNWIDVATAAPSRPIITVTALSGGRFHIEGSGFLPNKPVHIRVTAPLGQPSFTHSSKPNGDLDTVVQAPCIPGGAAYFEANDGRPDSNFTGVLWTKNVVSHCLG